MFKKEKTPKPPKEKKPGFLKRLKNKIDILFENDNFTMAGKFCMLSIYGVVISMFGITSLSVVGSILSSLCKLAGLKDIQLFTAALAVFWILFVFSFITAFVLVIIESVNLYSGDGSILTYPKKDE
ncbi:MAG: hypothetical protein J6N95_01230 [Bacilli bacterium]|nr:hypothetical protein [Bacilli bacterium]